jgi:hypothetical protein
MERLTHEDVQDYCETVVKPLFIAYKRSKEEFIYKLGVSFISPDCLEVPITVRLNTLSWYIREKHAQHIRFEYEPDVLRCFLYEKEQVKEKGRKEEQDKDLRPELLTILEKILEYWFEYNFKDSLGSFRNGITLVHISLNSLPIIKRKGFPYNSLTLF